MKGWCFMDVNNINLCQLCKDGCKVKIMKKNVKITDSNDIELMIISLDEYRKLKEHYNFYRDEITAEEKRKKERQLIWEQEIKKGVRYMK